MHTAAVFVLHQTCLAVCMHACCADHLVCVFAVPCCAHSNRATAPLLCWEPLLHWQCSPDCPHVLTHGMHALLAGISRIPCPLQAECTCVL